MQIMGTCNTKSTPHRNGNRKKEITLFGPMLHVVWPQTFTSITRLTLGMLFLAVHWAMISANIIENNKH